MFNDFNKVLLLGNVTQDPDLRFTPGGSPVLSFGLATNRRYKKNDEWVDDATFHNIVIWGNQAQTLAQRIKKGTKLFLEGRLQTRSWEGQDGQKRYKTEVVVDGAVSLLARYNEGPQDQLAPAPVSNARPENEEETPVVNETKGSEPQSKDAENEAEIDPDELPF